MKYLIIITLLIILALSASAEVCDRDPYCQENITSCGCGGNKTRVTLCDGGCGPWYPCSVPDTEENCNDNIDDDCDGVLDCADSDCTEVPFCNDADADGFTADVDCDDFDDSIYPGAEESCNLKDDNCDDQIDEDLTRSCGTTELGICTLGTETCFYGTWQSCTAILPATEVCDTKDNDCDGVVDEDCDCVGSETRPCGSTDVGACKFGTQTCTGSSWSVCSGSIEPVDEICDNIIDDDCDGVVDEGCQEITVPETVEADEETLPTTAPVESDPVEIPETPEITQQLKTSCIDEDGDGFGINCKAPDCDDFDAAIHLGATEVCNSKDDNCNGIVDEGLIRDCGVSSAGACTIGSERCTAGSWTGCTAVLPSTEICGNSIDDNCNGVVDESCKADELSSEELALDQFLALEYGEDKYDIDEILEAKKITEVFIDTRKTSSIADGKTLVKLTIRPKRPLKNFTVYEYIPKSLAESASEITFKVQPKVIRDDPLVVWHFAELKDPVDLSYELKKEVADAASHASTISFAEEAVLENEPWFVTFMPLFFIPIIGLLFIVVVEALKRKTH